MQYNQDGTAGNNGGDTNWCDIERAELIAHQCSPSSSLSYDPSASSNDINCFTVSQSV